MLSERELWPSVLRGKSWASELPTFLSDDWMPAMVVLSRVEPDCGEGATNEVGAADHDRDRDRDAAFLKRGNKK